MIVVEIKLHSAVDGRTEDLGTMIVHNTGGTQTHGNYSACMFKKGDAEKVGGVRRLMSAATPFRTGQVLNHRRLAEPVHNLIAKALTSMGYK